jgi:hypothetical protein
LKSQFQNNPGWLWKVFTVPSNTHSSITEPINKTYIIDLINKQIFVSGFLYYKNSCKSNQYYWMYGTFLPQKIL